MMIELTTAIEAYAGALTAALKAALPGAVMGVSTYGPGRDSSIWLQDDTSEADQATAQGIADAHDPVFVSVDKSAIHADGVDTATITVRAPKAGAAAVVLLANGNDVAVDLVDGVGTVEVDATDPGTVEVSVKNAENRSADTVTVRAA